MSEHAIQKIFQQSKGLKESEFFRNINRRGEKGQSDLTSDYFGTKLQEKQKEKKLGVVFL